MNLWDIIVKYFWMFENYFKLYFFKVLLFFDIVFEILYDCLNILFGYFVWIERLIDELMYW